MNLLVTGATSFLGSAVCRELLSRGHRVYAPVRKNSANLDSLPDSPELRRIFVPMEEIGRLRGKVEYIENAAVKATIGGKK